MRSRLSANEECRNMPYVVAEPCVKCKYTDCVSVCPTDSFREGANMLVIHPGDCIDCDACVPECPVNAIFWDQEIPEKWQEYVELNKRLSEEWPLIVEPKPPLDSAEEFATVEQKREHLSEAAGGE
jgi:ferredoxin